MRPSIRWSLAAVALAACGGGVKVNVNYDPQANPRMTAFQRWDWLAQPPGASLDTALAREVTGVLGAALSQAGFPHTPGDPQFRVGWHAAVTEPLVVTTINAYYGYTWGRWFPGGGVVFDRGFRTEVETGSLVMDIVDVVTGELVWRGIARGAFRRGRSPEDHDRDMAEAARRLVAGFPPVRPAQR